MASYPSPDPNLLGGDRVGAMRSGSRAIPFGHSSISLFARTYHPGFTFRFILALAALEEGLYRARAEAGLPRSLRAGRARLSLHEGACTGWWHCMRRWRSRATSTFIILRKRLASSGWRAGERFGFGQPMGLALGERAALCRHLRVLQAARWLPRWLRAQYGAGAGAVWSRRCFSLRWPMRHSAMGGSSFSRCSSSDSKSHPESPSSSLCRASCSASNFAVVTGANAAGAGRRRR